MTTLKEGIFTVLAADGTLSALVGDRIYPDVADQKKILPYIVYELDSENGVPHMTGVAALAQATVQFTVWASTSISRTAVNDALRALLDGDIRQAFGGVDVSVIRNINATDTKQVADDGSQNWNLGTFNDYEFWYLRT